MNEKERTLWMGNIEPWMSKYYLLSILNKLNIFPNKINLKKFDNKKGCAFLEFLSREVAEEILNKFNGKYINNFLFRLNWVKGQKNQKIANQNITFTVNKFFNNILQLYVGNIDKSITEEEIKEFFFKKYSSIIRLKLMKDIETNKSKGYGFIIFNDFQEYNHAINNKEPIIFGQQQLIFNSAKNKYDKSFDSNIIDNYDKFGLYYQKEKENDINIMTKNKYNLFYRNYFIQNKENFNFQNYQKSSTYFVNKRPFVEKENKFEIHNQIKADKEEKNNIENYSLNEQIKCSLQNIAKNYSNNDNFFKSKMCTYYCSPFIEKNILNMKKNLLK